MKKPRCSPCGTTPDGDFHNLTCTYYVFSYALNRHEPSAAGITADVFRKKRKIISSVSMATPGSGCVEGV